MAIFNYHSHFQRQGQGSQTRTLSCHLSPRNTAQYSEALVSNDVNGVMMLMSNDVNDTISVLKIPYHLLLVVL